MELKRSDSGFDYRPAVYKEKDWRSYIEFWVWDVQQQKLVRRRYAKGLGKTKTERRQRAKTLVREINEMLQKGYVIDRSQAEESVAPVFSLGEVIRQMIEVKVAAGKPRTQQAYRSFGNIFFAWAQPTGWEQRNIRDFPKSAVYAFRDWLHTERSLSNRSRNNYVEFFRALLGEAEKRGYIDKNPASAIPKLPVVESQYKAYTKEEQATLEAWLKANNYSLFLFTRFVYHGFIRPVEICRLQVKDIDLGRRVIMVDGGKSKTRRQRPVYITDNLLPFIEEMALDQHPGEYYLFSKTYQPGPEMLTRNRVSEAHRAALEAAGLYNGQLDLYSWKHTGNCNAYLAGVDVKALQEQNGHSNLAMTEKYLRSLGLKVGRGMEGKKW